MPSCLRASLPLAFTLIELLVALVIMGLIAGLAVYAFATPLSRVRALESIEQVRQVDASARAMARSTGRPTQVVIDLTEQSIARRESRHVDATFKTVLPAPMRVAEVRTAGRRFEYGEVVIGCSPLGLSETYAIKLTGTPADAGDSSADAGARWLVVAGLSGEIKTVRDEKDVDFILAGASATVPDRR